MGHYSRGILIKEIRHFFHKRLFPSDLLRSRYYSETSINKSLYYYILKPTKIYIIELILINLTIPKTCLCPYDECTDIFIWPFKDSILCISISKTLYDCIMYMLKSGHFKKTVARISFLSKLWYFQYKSKQKVLQF